MFLFRYLFYVCGCKSKLCKFVSYLPVSLVCNSVNYCTCLVVNYLTVDILVVPFKLFYCGEIASVLIC